MQKEKAWEPKKTRRDFESNIGRRTRKDEKSLILANLYTRYYKAKQIIHAKTINIYLHGSFNNRTTNAKVSWIKVGMT